MALQYIDLFDDELYSLAQIEAEAGSSERLLYLENSIRLQILLSIMRGNQIVLPEQWASSSAVCLKVISEVAQGYMDFRRNHGRKVFRDSEPFLLVRNPKHESEVDNVYVSVLINRLKNDSRLCLSSKVYDVNQQECYDNRQKLLLFFTDQKSHEMLSASKDLGDILSDDLADHILTVADYFNEFPKCVLSYNEKGYYGGIASRLTNVRAKCVPEVEGLEIFEKELFDELQYFFTTAKEEHGIKIYQLMDLWEHSKTGGYGADVQVFIENIGRNIMHSSMSEQINSGFTSFFHGSINSKADADRLGRVDPVVKKALDISISAQDDFSDSFDMFANNSYNELYKESEGQVTSSQAWAGTWDKIFELKLNKEFIEFHDSYVRQFEFRKHMSKQTGYEHHAKSHYIKELENYYANMNAFLKPLNFSIGLDHVTGTSKISIKDFKFVSHLCVSGAIAMATRDVYSLVGAIPGYINEGGFKHDKRLAPKYIKQKFPKLTKYQIGQDARRGAKRK